VTNLQFKTISIRTRIRTRIGARQNWADPSFICPRWKQQAHESASAALCRNGDRHPKIKLHS